VTHEQLTIELAIRVMRWRPTPNRFLTGNGSWKPRWKFQPAKRLEDALELLDAAGAEYDIRTERDGGFIVRVRIGGIVTEARGKSKPEAITATLGLALGITVEVRS
jgi:hypothetical protein